jgi:hypothetical protein
LEQRSRHRAGSRHPRRAGVLLGFQEAGELDVYEIEEDAPYA